METMTLDQRKRFFVRENGGTYTHILASTEDKARDLAHKKLSIKKPRLVSPDEAIIDLSQNGWAIIYRDEEMITFRKHERESNALICALCMIPAGISVFAGLEGLGFCLFFLVLAIICAIGSAAPKENVFTLRIN